MTNRSETPRTDKTIEKIKRDFGSDYPMMFGALQAHCEIQERELTAAQALAERQSGTLADINDGLRAILNDNIEGMERERIEEIADNWKDMIARAVRAEAELERCKKDAERYRWIRRKVCIIQGVRGATFDVLDLPSPTYNAPSPGVEFDAAIDAALSAKSEGGGR